MTAFSYGHHGCISPAANKLLAGEGAALNRVAIFMRFFVQVTLWLLFVIITPEGSAQANLKRG